MEEGAATATLDEHSEQSTIKGIRQLLSAVQALHHNSSSDSSVKEIMEHLESVDVNFHSYDLVCSIRKRIDEAIGPLVESRLEESVVEGDGHDTVPLILEEVLASNEYTGVCQAIVSSVESAVDSMLLDSSSLMISPDQQSSVSSTSSATQYFNLDDSISSEFSSAVNQTGLMFMPLEQIKGIVEHLGSHQQIDVRLRAMRSLHQFPPGDLLSNENWPELKQSLQKTLKDPNAPLSDLSLKLLARMFSSHTPKATKEAYSCLVEHLKWYFEDQHQPRVMDKIDIGEGNDVRLLKKFRLLNEFQKDVTTFWVRYNESIIRQMAADTFGLLSVCCGNSQLLTPFHFFALLDPKAQWFRKWMHGYYGRTEVLQQLKSFPFILKTCWKQVFDFPIKPLQTRPTKDGEFEMVYGLVELDTLVFTHCMSMLERLLLYKSGRQLFPVQLDGNNVHINDLLIKLVEMVLCHPTGSHDLTPAERELDPSHMAIHLIKEVAQGNEMCQEILCKDSILLSLIHPIRKLQEGQPSHTNEAVLLAIADLIAQLATSSKGLHCLLWGETGQKWQINKSAVSHVIAQFVAMSLDGSLTTKPSGNVTLAYLFVCRQLYKTGEGLMTLLQYSLHNLIAVAWRMAKDNEDGCYSPWKESLVDNLLNFAATPKGLLLLQQSGALESCTSYMFHRYKLKLQVSKCEKFGYGCMVTQVAAISPGMLALLNTGFVSEFVSDLWSLLEEGDDYHLVLSSSGPLDPSNRAAHKAMINLLNILSSYPALYEALSEPHRHHQARRHSSNDPTTIFELIDRLVLVDCSPKMTSLLNFQEAHLFGLRLFGIIMTCLDSYLLLESQYSICDALLALQKDCALDQGSYILDACSLERNWIIVSTNIIGGPSERILPSHTLVQDTDSCYPWPLFSSFPVPAAYRPQFASLVDSKDLSATELLLSLNSPVTSNGQWLDKVKEAFCNALLTEHWLSTDTILLLLSRCLPVLRSMDSCQFSPISTDLANSNVIPDQMDILGVQLVHKYGVYLGLVQDNSGTMNDLHMVLSTIKMQLKAQQHSNKPTLGFLKTSQAGFDWFVATVFLITRGSLQLTLNTLQEISCLLTSAYLWPSRVHKSVHLPKSLAFSGIPPVFSVIMHLVELILQDEVPLCYSAFKLSGFTPSQICQHWLQQCFWNYLDWPEICLYIVVCIIMGNDYQVYMCVAILKHLEAQILKHTQEQNLLVFLKVYNVNLMNQICSALYDWRLRLLELHSVDDESPVQTIRSTSVSADILPPPLPPRNRAAKNVSEIAGGQLSKSFPPPVVPYSAHKFSLGCRSKLSKDLPTFAEALQNKCHIKWKSCSDLPCKLYNASVAVSSTGDQVYVTAGAAPDDSTHNNVFFYNTTTDHWTILPQPGHRRGILHMLDDKLTIIGGSDPVTCKFQSKVTTYNSDTNSWYRCYPDMLNKRYMPGVITYQNYIMVMGGMNSPDSIHDNIEIMDYQNDLIWKIISIKLPVPMWSIKPTISGNGITIVGYTSPRGRSNKCYQIAIEEIVSSFSHGQSSTSASVNQWKKLLPALHYDTAIIPYSMLPVSIGGRGHDNQDSVPTSDVTLYDPSKNAWRKVDSLTKARGYVGVGLLNNSSIIVIGGCRGGSDIEGCKALSLTTVEIGTIVHKKKHH